VTGTPAILLLALLSTFADWIATGRIRDGARAANSDSGTFSAHRVWRAQHVGTRGLAVCLWWGWALSLWPEAGVGGRIGLAAVVVFGTWLALKGADLVVKFLRRSWFGWRNRGADVISFGAVLSAGTPQSSAEWTIRVGQGGVWAVTDPTLDARFGRRVRLPDEPHPPRPAGWSEAPARRGWEFVPVMVEGVRGPLTLACPPECLRFLIEWWATVGHEPRGDEPLGKPG
jgi:hypothetical protein